MSTRRWRSIVYLLVAVAIVASCVAPAAVPSASPPAASASPSGRDATSSPSAREATSSPPDATSSPSAPASGVEQLRFRTDEGRSVAVDFDDQSGLLIGATKGEPFVVDNPDNKLVVLLNDASDDAVLRVEWLAAGGCAPQYVVRIDETARKMQIEGPAPGSDSIGGNCDLTLRFSQPVPAGDVEAALVYTS